MSMEAKLRALATELRVNLEEWLSSDPELEDNTPEVLDFQLNAEEIESYFDSLEITDSVKIIYS